MSMPGAFSPELPPSEPAPKDDKPFSADRPAFRLDEPSDAFSLHTNEPYFDDAGAASSSAAVLDLPPSYTDDPASATADGSSPALLADESGPSPLLFHKDTKTGAEIHLSRLLDTDPAYLEAHITSLAQSPPRLYASIRGTHTERVRKRDDKTETNTVLDFDLRIDITPFLYRDISARQSWSELRTADNFQKVRRGTVFPTRAPGFGGSSVGGVTEGAKPPTLREWCHRYCASHAGLKTFVLSKTVTGFDEDERLRNQLQDLVRATHYRGRINVSFPVQDAKIEVYNSCRVNRWRFTTGVCLLFFVTFLWVFAWPYLFFRTKRFEVVDAEWAFSRRKRNPQTGRVVGREYVSVSEDQWYNMWARAIHRAVLDRRHGELDQRDLRDAEGRQDTSFGDVLAAGMDEETTRGLVRAGISAMNVVNRHFGWGGDC